MRAAADLRVALGIAVIHLVRDSDVVERRIRTRERQTIRWLREKPWLDGKRLAETVRRARRLHTESVGRSK